MHTIGCICVQSSAHASLHRNDSQLHCRGGCLPVPAAVCLAIYPSLCFASVKQTNVNICHCLTRVCYTRQIQTSKHVKFNFLHYTYPTVRYSFAQCFVSGTSCVAFIMLVPFLLPISLTCLFDLMIAWY